MTVLVQPPSRQQCGRLPLSLQTSNPAVVVAYFLGHIFQGFARAAHFVGKFQRLPNGFDGLSQDTHARSGTFRRWRFALSSANTEVASAKPLGSDACALRTSF